MTEKLVTVCPRCLPQVSVPESMLFGATQKTVRATSLRGRSMSADSLSAAATAINTPVASTNLNACQYASAFEYPFLVASSCSATALSSSFPSSTSTSSSSHTRAATVEAFIGETHVTPIIDSSNPSFSLSNAACLCYLKGRCICLDSPAPPSSIDSADKLNTLLFQEAVQCRCFSCHHRRQHSTNQEGCDPQWSAFMNESVQERQLSVSGDIERHSRTRTISTEWSDLDAEREGVEFGSHSTNCLCRGSGVGCECMHCCNC